jgi:phospholipid/cholesterol/gamma-HCH transport system substrate-binding protein
LSAKLNKIADSVGQIIGNNEGDMKQTVSSLRSSMDKLNDSLAHLQSTARKIDEGQGTVGKLINDSTLHDNISEAAEGANQLIKRINGFETEVELRAEYHVPIKPDDVLINPSGYLKNYVSLKLKPKPDTYYMIELVSDPLGSQSRTVTTTSHTSGGVTSPQQIDDTTTIDLNALKVSLEFAKRFAFITLRFGIIENTGGAGFNMHALSDRLELRGDVYDFGDKDRFGNALNPHLRSYALYEPIKHLYLHAGVDDILNYHYLSITGGAGIRFNDEDLKALLGLIATGASGAR